MRKKNGRPRLLKSKRASTCLNFSLSDGNICCQLSSASLSSLPRQLDGPDGDKLQKKREKEKREREIDTERERERE